MGGYQTGQILWYFYQIITDKYNIMEHNNSPRSITKKSVLRHVRLIFFTCFAKSCDFRCDFYGKNSRKQ